MNILFEMYLSDSPLENFKPLDKAYWSMESRIIYRVGNIILDFNHDGSALSVVKS